MDLEITINGQEYNLSYNPETGYYEKTLNSPSQGGIYPVKVNFTDLLGNFETQTKNIQILVKKEDSHDSNRSFMWIFSYYDFSIKAIKEISSFEFNIDEETNNTSMIKVIGETNAKSRDIIAIKRNDKVLYWGIISNIQNDDGGNTFTYVTKYITNMFDQKVMSEFNVVGNIEEGYYRFKSVLNSENTIAVKNKSIDDNASCVLWERQSYTNQIWKAIQSGTNYIFKNLMSGLYLNVADKNYIKDGQDIVQSIDSYGWKIHEISSGIYNLYTNNDLKAIDISDGVIANGTRIQDWENSTINAINRQWYLEKTLEPIIKENGIEDFIAEMIRKNFTNSDDTFENIAYLDIEVKTHTKLNTSVQGKEKGIFNLHTFMTNCTQNYGINFEFKIENKRLKLIIENRSNDKILIDTKAQNISNYEETFETSIVSKVVCSTDTGIFYLYLKTDRTTTTDATDPDRAEGLTTTIYTEKMEDAYQSCLNEIQSNKYNHNITFSTDMLIPVGTPVAIKTKKSAIEDTYISAVQITEGNFYTYQTGNIRMNFIEKLLKARL